MRVGGIARTEEYRGCRFDIGGHRFFTKADQVRDLWHAVLPADQWLTVRRMSRIYYHRKFFDYPLKAVDTLRKLGVLTAFLCVLSYLRARLWPRRQVRSYEDWIVNHFGLRLYRIFFKTYTEKVWGRPCSEISADWAAQRIKRLSLLSAVRNTLPRLGRSGDEVIKTLIDTFDYPEQGPGQMWECAAEQVREAGGSVTLAARVTEVHHDAGSVTGVVVEFGGEPRMLHGSDYVATIPLPELVGAMRPSAPAPVRAAPLPWSTATTSPWCSSSTGLRCFPTTGSTSTSPTCYSAGSRTIRTGRRRWCPTSGRWPSDWSTSRLRATSACGRWATTS